MEFQFAQKRSRQLEEIWINYEKKFNRLELTKLKGIYSSAAISQNQNVAA